MGSGLMLYYTVSLGRAKKAGSETLTFVNVRSQL